MIISESHVALQATREASEIHRKHESLTYWRRDGRPESVEMNSNRPSGGFLRFQFEKVSAQLQASNFRSSVQIDISDRALQLQQNTVHKPHPHKKLESSTEITMTDEKMSLQISLISLLVEKITGKKLQLFNPEELQQKQQETEDHAGNLKDSKSARQVQEQGVGWGLRYESGETHYESEKVSFSAEAKRKTADGREISLELELNMSREFYSEEKKVSCITNYPLFYHV